MPLPVLSGWYFPVLGKYWDKARVPASTSSCNICPAHCFLLKFHIPHHRFDSVQRKLDGSRYTQLIFTAHPQKIKVRLEPRTLISFPHFSSLQDI